MKLLPQFPAIAATDRGAWATPHFIPHDEAIWVDGGTFLHKACRSWFLAHRKEMLDQMSQKVNALTESGDDSGHRAVDTNPDLQVFAWGEGGDSDVVKGAGVKVHLKICKELESDARLEAWPWRGHRAVLQQLSGSSVVVVLGHDLASSKQDFVNWLSTAHHSALGSAFNFCS